MTAVPITEPGVFVPASVAARIRHGLVENLQRALRNGERVPEEVADAIGLIDSVGAWHDQRVSPSVSPNVSQLAPQDFDHATWLTVNTAADMLDITPQAMRGLLRRGSVDGRQVGRTWRVNPESVTARREQACPH